MLIRAELPSDVAAIDDVLVDAFADPERDGMPPEMGLVRQLRGSEAWIPQQSLIGEEDEVVVGHCLCTRATVGEVPCLALGPIGVLGSRQRRGVGAALVNTAIDIAVEMSEPLIGLVGDPAYYARFGFVPGTTVGIDPPQAAWGVYFQVLPLPTFGLIEGVFRYPAPFMALG